LFCQEAQGTEALVGLVAVVWAVEEELEVMGETAAALG